MRRYRTKDYHVEHYEADLMPDPTNHSLRGNVVIRIASLVPDLNTVALDADALAIEKASEGDGELRVDVEPGLARVRLARPAGRGQRRTIRIWFHAQPKRGMSFPARIGGTRHSTPRRGCRATPRPTIARPSRFTGRCRHR